MAEPQRKKGLFTYPLWKGNLLILWGVFFVAALILACGITLPRFIGLELHGVKTQAVITQAGEPPACRATYNYTVGGVNYTGGDNQCGLTAGSARTAYYDALAPESSTLYLPSDALRNQILAAMLISAGLAAFLVLWFRITYVIEGPDKP